MKTIRIPLVIVLFVVAGRAFDAGAQTETNLYSFVGSPTDGNGPLAGLVQGSDGNFYGTTYEGGTAGGGTVFRISPSGTETTLYSFVVYPTDGAYPYARLVQGSDGNFYGTTFYGGTNDDGTVFRISPSGTYTNLYSFVGSPTDGNVPVAGLVQGSDGNLYGTTAIGGANGNGTVFRISPSGSETNLYSFLGSPTDGAGPYAGLVQGSDGNFYGTTQQGGTTGYGTVFRISPSGSETNLYSFLGFPDGANPNAGLVQGSDGYFYGTTELGGTNYDGTVFRISPSGAYTSLYSFVGSPIDGYGPTGGLVQGNDGNFYGTTDAGGTTNFNPYNTLYGYGTVFRISPSGIHTSLYSFVGSPTDGTYPYAGLVQGSDGNFYGTTQQGGTNGDGTVFRFSVPLSVTANSWVAGNGKWETGGNWSLGTAPSAVDPADLITNATSKTVTIDAVTAGFPSTLTISNLTVSAPLGSANTLFLTNAGMATPLSILNALAIGANGALVVNQSAVQVGSNLLVGVAGGSGALSITSGGQMYDPFGYIGHDPSSSNNTVLVTGSGSVWSNSYALYEGYYGGGNSLTVTNGGVVLSGGYGYIAYLGTNNTALVTGSGSVWSNALDMYVGDAGPLNSLVIASSGAVYNGFGFIGIGTFANSNTVLVTGSGSVWSNALDVLVGAFGSSNSMTVSNGGAVYNRNGSIGCYDVSTSSSNNTVLVTGSGSVWNNAGYLYVGEYGAGNSLTVTTGAVVTVNGPLVVGTGFGGGPNSLILNGGSVTVNQLALTNGASSVIAFNGGLLASSGTSVTNTQVFVVGDGTDAATFQLNGGVHSFANNLEIASNAFLTGCGTIEGNVTIDPGGTVLANCGGTLTFSGMVTNNGTMQAVNGTVLQADGLVVNNGLIIATNGTAVFLGGLVNNGVVLTNGCSLTEADVQISSIARFGNKIVIQIPSVTCATYQLQVTPSLNPATWTNLNASQSGTGEVLSFTDSNGATNRPGRFYRIDITLP